MKFTKKFTKCKGIAVRKPFYVKRLGLDYAWIDGKQVKLGSTEQEAWDWLHELSDERGSISRATPVVVRLDEFVGWLRVNRAKATGDRYELFLTSFGRHLGNQGHPGRYSPPPRPEVGG